MAAKVKAFYKMAYPFLGAIAGIQFMVAVGVGSVLFLNEQGRQRERLQVYESQVAGVVDGFLEAQQTQLKALSSMPPEHLNVDMPGVMKLRFIPAGAEIPLDLSFTHQDMLRRTLLQRKPVAPEVSLPQGGGGPVFSQVAAVKGGGWLLMMTPLDPLKSGLKTVAASGGVLLTQKIGEGGTPSELAAVNDAASGRPVTVANPNWQMKVAPPSSGMVFLWIILSVLGLTLIAMPLLSVLMVRMYERKFRHDVSVLHGVTRGEEHSSPLHFETLQELWSHLMTHGSKAVFQDKPAVPGMIRTHDVAGIVQAVEAQSEPVPPRPALEEILGSPPAPEAVEPAVEHEEVKELTPLEFTPGAKRSSSAPQKEAVPSRIFRDYDIRGKADEEITPDLAKKIGQAVATEAIERGERRIVVGRDARLSSESLCRALMEGILSAGCDVINVGMVPSPALYFAAKNLGSGSGVMVTASHNPGADNGFKIMLANHTLAGDEIRALRDRILRAEFAKGAGAMIEQSIEDDYIQQITEDVLLARTFNVVVDAGNGIAGPMAVRMLEEMGCTVSPLYCDPDGRFPHHDPDPSNPHNLEDLLSDVAIGGADLGLAFDGDGDRVVVVTNSTRIVASDKLLMLFAKEVLSTQPGADIIFDVKCSRDLVSVITSAGGRPVMTRTGHSWLKTAVAESGAPLAGELSGHFIFNDRWQGFDDGLYAAARFLEILAASDGTVDDLFSQFPERVSTPEIHIAISENERAVVLESLGRQAESVTDGTVNTTDGVRIEFAHGWGVVRASNTGAYLTARFEANDEDSLERIKDFFREQLLEADPMLLISF